MIPDEKGTGICVMNKRRSKQEEYWCRAEIKTDERSKES